MWTFLFYTLPRWWDLYFRQQKPTLLAQMREVAKPDAKNIRHRTRR